MSSREPHFRENQNQDNAQSCKKRLLDWDGFVPVIGVQLTTMISDKNWVRRATLTSRPSHGLANQVLVPSKYVTDDREETVDIHEASRAHRLQRVLVDDLETALVG